MTSPACLCNYGKPFLLLLSDDMTVVKDGQHPSFPSAIIISLFLKKCAGSMGLVFPSLLGLGDGGQLV